MAQMFSVIKHKRFAGLISVIFLLGTAVNASAVDKDWTNGNGNRLWRTAANWSGSVVPTSSDKAAIRNQSISGPIIDSSTTAAANQIVVGDWSSTNDTLDMTGGTLTTSGASAWLILGYGAPNHGTFTISAGTVTIGDTLFVGFNGNGLGIGTLNMTGGTITVTNTFGIAQGSSTGNVSLAGGTISCGSFNMTTNGRLDITTGTLLISGNVDATIGTYVTNGWITAYGGTGTVNHDYNVTNPGKTTVTASPSSSNPPGKATNPNPANSVSDVATDATLSWTAGSGTTSHDVYFGTENPPPYQINQTAATFNPGTLDYSTTYYWRIDENNANGTTTGDLWSFTTTLPGNYVVGAYYYPWYTDSYFHAGGSPAGHTTLVYHLNPRMTPQLGWYNQNNSSVISQHLKWARYAGIDFFAASYWGTGSGDTVIKSMFTNPDRGNIKIAAFIETTKIDTATKITNEMNNNLCPNYFNQPCYLKFDGKPVIFLYLTRAMSPSLLYDYTYAIRTTAASYGYSSVYIVGDEVWGAIFESGRVDYLDAITNYDVCGNLGIWGSGNYVTTANLTSWNSNNHTLQNKCHTWCSTWKDFFPAVTPGFNDSAVRTGNTPRSRKLNDNTYPFGSLFSSMLEMAKTAADRNVIMVTSWNEWHEDTQIEPVTPAADTNQDDGGGIYTQGLYYNGYGMLYLYILRDKTVPHTCDFYNQGTVNFYDLAYLLDYWLITSPNCLADAGCIKADVAINGTIDLADFAYCGQFWTGTGD